mgnify:CR=1 FL=1
MSKYMVITNNPLVRSRLDDTHEVIYLELSYEELLKVVRDRIYEIIDTSIIRKCKTKGNTVQICADI